MQKKQYTEPTLRTISLGILESMLASTAGTGNNLVSTGDYDGDDFDNLFE